MQANSLRQGGKKEMKDYEYKRAVVDVCHMLNEAGFVGTYEGNISYKKEDKIFITPTQTSKALISEGQIITIDPKGNVLEGDLNEVLIRGKYTFP